MERNCNSGRESQDNERAKSTSAQLQSLGLEIKGSLNKHREVVQGINTFYSWMSVYNSGAKTFEPEQRLAREARRAVVDNLPHHGVAKYRIVSFPQLMSHGQTIKSCYQYIKVKCCDWSHRISQLTSPDLHINNPKSKGTNSNSVIPRHIGRRGTTSRAAKGTGKSPKRGVSGGNAPQLYSWLIKTSVLTVLHTTEVHG